MRGTFSKRTALLKNRAKLPLPFAREGVGDEFQRLTDNYHTDSIPSEKVVAILNISIRLKK